MDSKLLLVKIITLLFRESQLSLNKDNSAQLCRDVLNTIRLPEVTIDNDRSRDVVSSLRATALWMIENPPDHEYDRSELLQRIRVNVADDESLYHAIADGTKPIKSEEKLQEACLQHQNDLRTYLQRGRIKQVIKNASHKVMFNEEEINWRSFVPEVIGELEPFVNELGEQRQEGMVEDITLGEDGVTEVFRKAKKETTNGGGLKTGWQAVNRMCGPEIGGIRRGELVVVGALQHNFKTGFTLSLFKHLALYNKPQLRNKKKKPMIMHLSFENELETNLMWLYANLKENETGEQADLHNVSEEEAARYVFEKMQTNGYTINMCRIDPSEYTFHDLFARISYYESKGYEIHAVVCDYLNMMSKRGCTYGASGAEIRDLYRRVRNFCSPRGIAFITPHQLSPEAKYLLRHGIDNFVQEVAGKGYWDSCKSIDQEIDLELIIHIEKVNNEKYLTIQRGKHRKVKVTPEKYLYTVLKFEDVATIPDDINGKDLSRRYIGGSAVADGGNKPWYAM